MLKEPLIAWIVLAPDAQPPLRSDRLTFDLMVIVAGCGHYRVTGWDSPGDDPELRGINTIGWLWFETHSDEEYAVRWYLAWEANHPKRELAAENLGNWSEQASHLPRFWALVGYLLPPRARAKVYEPALNELIEDQLLARRRFTAKGARAWLALCDFLRRALLFLDCCRVTTWGRIAVTAARLVREAINWWWHSG